MKKLNEKLARTVRTLNNAELGKVSGGVKKIKFGDGDTITVTNSVSGGAQDDCKD